MTQRSARFAKAQPTVADVHINRPLTDVSVAFMQNATDFVADRVFPTVPVAKQSDLYFVYEREDWYRSQAERRAPGTESAGSGWNLYETEAVLAVGCRNCRCDYPVLQRRSERYARVDPVLRRRR